MELNSVMGEQMKSQVEVLKIQITELEAKNIELTTSQVSYSMIHIVLLYVIPV